MKAAALVDLSLVLTWTNTLPVVKAYFLGSVPKSCDTRGYKLILLDGTRVCYRLRVCQTTETAVTAPE
jgi:hypothetical protein